MKANKISDNARDRDRGQDLRGRYLGEVTSRDLKASLGITNAEDLLQVSPTQAASVPTKDFESFSTYGRTFASMTRSAIRQVAGDPQRVRRQGVRERTSAAQYGPAPSSQARPRVRGDGRGAGGAPEGGLGREQPRHRP